MDLTQVFVLSLLTLQVHGFFFPRGNTTQSQQPTPDTSPKECIDGISAWYRGHHNYTVSGILCQRWDAIVPHVPKQTPPDGGHHNYCRNPDRDVKGTWCYTTDAKKRWEYCGIPKCADDSRVMWTDYDMNRNVSRIMAINADPEAVGDYTKSENFVKTLMVVSNQSLHEYWALTGDYHQNLLVFADRKYQYIGVQNLETNQSEKRFEGIAYRIESLAYDWDTGNLYWTDSSFNWIMVVDPTWRHYSYVYREERGMFTGLYALALHSKKRKLFFSSYQHSNSSFCVIDLSGRNKRVMLRYPQIDDVTGITVDYTDDRVYWTSYNGFGTFVSSSNLDGSNVTQYTYAQASIFWGIASYLDFLYVTEVTNTTYHSVRVISKEVRKELYRYSMKGRPRGIWVMSRNEERSFDEDLLLGSCRDPSAPKCDHICLPRVGVVRECACSLGFQKQGDTSCVARKFEDEFLVLSDEGHGRIFQIPLNNDNITYSVFETSDFNSSRVTSVSVNPISKDIYWADRSLDYLLKSKLNRSGDETRYNGSYASYVLADPCTGNLFIVDAASQSIKVMSPSGKMKTILQHDWNATVPNSIQVITQDMKNKKLYWTDTLNTEGMGQVWRMNTDGSEKELVLESLNWPIGITVDHARESLFISEALTAMVYEQPLSSLETITSTAPYYILRQHDLSGHLPRYEFLIADIKVHKDFLYFTDRLEMHLERIDLNTGPASMARFGPSDFISVTSLSIFSTDTEATGADCSLSRCAQRNLCDDICIDLGPDNQTCLCDDDSEVLSPTSCLYIPKTNFPPSHRGTCPHGIVINLDECQHAADAVWSPPSWTDDHTPDRLLTFSKPPQLDSLYPGIHSIVYTATDQHGLTSECTFPVSVRGVNCSHPPYLPGHLKISTPTCDWRYGSMVHIMCKDPSLTLVYNNIERDELLTLRCNDQGTWAPFTNFTLLACAPARAKIHEMTSLDGGKIALVCVVVFVFLIAAVFAALMRRRKGNLWLIKINFPKIWRRKNDSVHLGMTT